MIELFEFQQRAVSQIVQRFGEYWEQRPYKGVGKRMRFVPFYQALASITASGKTAIMAATCAELLPVLPVKPIVIWLSKGRVVVDQTYANLQEGGKYNHLLGSYTVRLLAEYEGTDVEDDSLSLVYLATVGTFNQRDKEKGNLKLFQSDLDTADRSIWEALGARLTSEGVRRPLLIVYDEAHNLTDQQTALLMELEPDALLLATATPKLPQAIARVIADLRDALEWGDGELNTYVDSRDVVEEGLVKRQVLLGGYQAPMEEAIDDLLTDMKRAQDNAAMLPSPLVPKAIYVCKTNIVEGNAYKQDNPKRPFYQREAPPILIWRYLVDQRGIDPSLVAVYTSALKFDKAHPPPAAFVQFRGGDKDYSEFVAGNFQHVIFNLGLQEGWDDPECYFAYIDKSMQSNIQVEQVIGRVLRQPGATHFNSDDLNTAHFYVRIDTKGVFAEIVREIGDRLSRELPDVTFTTYDRSKKSKPVLIAPTTVKSVPNVWRDPSAAEEPIDAVIKRLIDFRSVTDANVRGSGYKALVQQTVGEAGSDDLEWVEREHSNAVSARWIFQTSVRRQFPLALEVTRSDDPKFDARIELGSPADALIRKTADEVVRLYLENVVLKQRLQNPYVVGGVMVDPSSTEEFANALHPGYSGLNKSLELPFAHELDKTRARWCRNPSRSGFAIPLLSLGRSRAFYPDFLVWKGKNVFAIDTTGEHILEEKLGRKLLAIEPHPQATVRLLVRLVSQGEWDHRPQRLSGKGFTVWTLGPGHELKPITVETMREAAKTALRVDL